MIHIVFLMGREVSTECIEAMSVNISLSCKFEWYRMDTWNANITNYLNGFLNIEIKMTFHCNVKLYSNEVNSISSNTIHYKSDFTNGNYIKTKRNT